MELLKESSCWKIVERWKNYQYLSERVWNNVKRARGDLFRARDEPSTKSELVIILYFSAQITVVFSQFSSKLGTYDYAYKV